VMRITRPGVAGVFAGAGGGSKAPRLFTPRCGVRGE
jgi:hypothetical protein